MKLMQSKAIPIALLLTNLLSAQEQATNLTRLCQKADVAVEASVTASQQVSSNLIRVQFQANQGIKGSIGNQFSLFEPAGRCCGRSLFGLVPGDRRVLFLKRVGATFHIIGGERGILPSSIELLNHLQAVVAAPSTNALTRLLAANINHSDQRIANDAILALALVPNLSLTATERITIANSLSQSVAMGSTRTAPLADIAARLNDANTVDSLMPVYLQAKRNDQALLLRKALNRCSAPLVAARLPMFVGTTRSANLRAARLLTELPDETALAAMTTLLQRPNHPQVQVHLCEGLLAAGVSSSSLNPLVPGVVLQMAIERQNSRPVFRNINPHR